MPCCAVAGVFVGLGLTGIVPTIHYLLFARVVQSSSHIVWLGTMTAFYGIGAAVYAARIPERLSPGTCDLMVSQNTM